MSSNSSHHRGPERTDGPEVIDPSEVLNQFSGEQRSTLQRAALAHTMHADEPRNAALESMAERANNRSPEDVQAAVLSVLTEERLRDLHPGGVRLWQTGGHAIMETNHGYSESSGDNEYKVIREIHQRPVTTSRWGLQKHSGHKSYMGMYGKKYQLDRSLLEQDLLYVSQPIRYTIPQGDDPEKIAPFQERADLFERYKATLLELIEVAQSPADEQQFVSENGSVAVDQVLKRHCTNFETAKGSVKIMALGVILAIAAAKIVFDKKLTLSSIALIGVIMFLVGKNPKMKYLKDSRFLNFCSENVSGDTAAAIMGLPPKKRSAMLRYFKSHQTETLTAEHIKRITEPNDRSRAAPEDIAHIFTGMTGAAAFNYANAILEMGRTKEKGTVIDFLDANYDSSAQVQRDMQTITNASTPSS